MINEAGGVKRVTETGVVKGMNGKMLGFFVASGTPTVKLWDNASAGSGTVLLNTVQTVAATWYAFPASYANGVYATVTGAGDISFIVS
jgi:hypothetical protein